MSMVFGISFSKALVDSFYFISDFKNFMWPSFNKPSIPAINRDYFLVCMMVYSTQL